jgi:hypothetical protein
MWCFRIYGNSAPEYIHRFNSLAVIVLQMSFKQTYLGPSRWDCQFQFPCCFQHFVCFCYSWSTRRLAKGSWFLFRVSLDLSKLNLLFLYSGIWVWDLCFIGFLPPVFSRSPTHWLEPSILSYWFVLIREVKSSLNLTSVINLLITYIALLKSLHNSHHTFQPKTICL